MKLIKQSYEIIPQASGLEGIYKQIEKAGRTCYKSEDKITEDSAKEFVNRMIKSNHTAMLEHGTVYLKFKWWQIGKMLKYGLNKYSKGFKNVTTNYRVIVENNWLKDLKYLCEPTEHHEKRITVKFTTNIGISREFTRHRVMSLAVESTRYCNYSKNKFGKALTFIIPDWCTYIDEGESYFHDGICFRTGASESNYYFGTKSWTKPTENENQDSWNKQLGFIKYMNFVETTYLKLISIGMKPDQVRGILPLDTKCDMIMTGFVSDWKHFFSLRALGTTGKPHPQAKELAEPLMEDFKKLNLLC